MPRFGRNHSGVSPGFSTALEVRHLHLDGSLRIAYSNVESLNIRPVELTNLVCKDVECLSHRLDAPHKTRFANNDRHAFREETDICANVNRELAFLKNHPKREGIRFNRQIL